MKVFESQSNIENANIAVIDTETSLKSNISNEIKAFYDIVEIGVVVAKLNFESIETFQSLVKPFFRFNPSSCVAPHITSALLENAPKFPQIIDRIISILENCIIVGQNTQFDIRAIKMALEIYCSVGLINDNQGEKLRAIINRPYFDTRKLYKILFPQEKNSSLTHITNKLDIHINIGEKHMALEDALLTLEVFKSLVQLTTVNGVSDFSDLLQFQNGNFNRNSQMPLF